MEQKKYTLETTDVTSLEVQLKNCKELLSFYEDKIPFNMCPLCTGPGDCYNCPWVWFTEHVCTQMQLSDRYAQIPPVSVKYYERSLYPPDDNEVARLARIEDLKKWIPAIEKELEKRKEE